MKKDMINAKENVVCFKTEYLYLFPEYEEDMDRIIGNVNNMLRGIKEIEIYQESNETKIQFEIWKMNYDEIIYKNNDEFWDSLETLYKKLNQIIKDYFSIIKKGSDW